MKRIIFIVAALLALGLYMSSALASSMTADLTFSWQVWQDLDLDQVPDPGEIVDTSGLSTSWQLNASYFAFGFDDSFSGSTIFDQTGSDPINGLSQSASGSEGTGSGSASVTGGSETLTLHSDVTIGGGLVGARVENISASSNVFNINFAPFNLGNFSSGTGENDPPLYLSVLIDSYNIDTVTTCTPPNCATQGVVNISTFAGGNTSTNDFQVIDIDLFDTGFQSSDSGSAIALEPIRLFPLFSDSAGEFLDGVNWNLSAQARGFASVPGVEGPSVPEPSTMMLVVTGLAGLAWFRRKFRM